MTHLSQKTSVLLINLGTPDKPSFYSVAKYLNEFLSDKRVIDLNFLKRHLLVKGLVIPLRLRNTTKSYQAIWSQEGSPLLTHTKNLAESLQKVLPQNYQVHFAMRYQSPSLSKELKKIEKERPQKLIVIPLFPQYSSACNGSSLEEVFKTLASWASIPDVLTISSFFDHEQLIKAFAAKARPLNPDSYDTVLFSFHGLPHRQLKKLYPETCCKKTDCCHQLKKENAFCYAAQSFYMANSIAKELNLPTEKYQVCFQSRLGKEPWLEPFTSQVLEKLAQEKQRVLVFSPSFICDCLETSYEIEEEYREEFLQKGGKELHLVPGLNSSPEWVECLRSLVLQKTKIEQELKV